MHPEPPRLKVLISAYACEPNKGSEPEVGWQWSLQMARYHDVTVLTRYNNRAAIEAALPEIAKRQPVPRFVYHDRDPFLMGLKSKLKSVRIYYVLWQKSAWEVIHELHQQERFDLMHHVTFAGFRYPIAIWGHGAPSIWGPIGGIESIPKGLLPWKHGASLLHEFMRNLNNLVQAMPFHVLPQRALASTLIIASTPEMRDTFVRLGFQPEMMPTIGLHPRELPFIPKQSGNPKVPLKLLFVGNIITLKGVDFALEGLAASGTDATLTFIGSGNFQRAAEKFVANHHMTHRVKFIGRLPRAEVLKAYREYDVFIFPSLHDTGGYAVIEAMFNELPVICLDYGGPGVAVCEGCGIKVPMQSRAGVIRGVTEAIRYYDQDREAVLTHGRAARQSILDNYDWEAKGHQLNQCYGLALKCAEARSHGAGSRYAGMGRVAELLHRMISFKGIMASLAGLMIIGALGFLTVGHLKDQANDIAADTLPGLSLAGTANETLAQAFENTLQLLLTVNPDEKQRLSRSIDQLSQRTTQSLAAYRGAMFSDADEQLYEELLEARKQYLNLRLRVVHMDAAGARSTALALAKNELLPAYNRYRDAAQALFTYNMEQGKVRGTNIMMLCTVTQVAAAAVGILLFLGGFLIGLFK